MQLMSWSLVFGIPLSVLAVTLVGQQPWIRVSPAPMASRPMTNAKLEELLRDKFGEALSGERGHWQADHLLPSGNTVRFMCMTDARAGVDRMRFMVPIVKVEDGMANEELFGTLLKANYDRAVDARYAIDRGYVWGAFLHPLSSLTEEHAKSGISQVLNLAQNFGNSFSSTNVVFIGGREARNLIPPSSERREEASIDQLHTS